ncbi:MAG: hypothetical protein GXO58_02175 [Thermodesulfobacteria bacterium]|nr:hypothetical protein [Thermodesulfobacteriota bacterium]
MMRIILSLLFLVLLSPGYVGAYTIRTLDYEGYSTWLTGINDSGQIVGYYADNSGRNHGLIYDESTSEFTVIDYDDSSNDGSTMPMGINNNGQIVGVYSTSGVQGFTYDSTNGFQLVNYSGNDLMLFKINDSGQYVGTTFPNPGESEGLVYDPNSGFQTVKYGTNNTWFAGNNNDNIIVGSIIDDSGQYNGIKYTSSGFQVINISDHPTIFYDINDQGLIVGDYEDFSNGGYIGFIYNPDGSVEFVDFNDNVLWLIGTNNNGEIVGSYVDGSSRHHGLLIMPEPPNPVPLPTTALLLASGLGLLPIFRKIKK